MDESQLLALSKIEINPWSIVLSLIFSTLGIYLFKQGRKNENSFWIYIGVILFIYTYFITDPIPELIIGLGLTYAAYVKRWG